MDYEWPTERELDLERIKKEYTRIMRRLYILIAADAAILWLLISKLKAF